MASGGAKKKTVSPYLKEVSIPIMKKVVPEVKKKHPKMTQAEAVKAAYQTPEAKALKAAYEKKHKK